MTNDAARGSGFLCVENDDPAAERFATLLDEAQISPSKATVWNAYPWYINRKPRSAELDAGVDPLHHLLERLPSLRVVMLNGGEAHVIWRKLTRRHPQDVDGLEDVLRTYHTSRQAFIGTVEVREARLADLRANFARAAEILRQPRLS